MTLPLSTSAATSRYVPVQHDARIDLVLDRNEGPEPDAPLLQRLANAGPGADAVRRYPDKSELEAQIAALHGLEPQQVLVTAGGDEAIDRICRAFLNAAREIVLPGPTFEMIERYAVLTGAAVRPVRWSGAFPLADAMAAVNERSGVVAVVSPNNPTGAVVDMADIRAISRCARHCIVLLDLAYVELADIDVTAEALKLPNVIIVRTFSKAWGLAGLRVGYAMGSADAIDALRGAGGPFPVSSLSLAAASHQLTRGEEAIAGYVAQVRQERRDLTALLDRLGADAQPSQANFVFCRVTDAQRIQRDLAEAGIAVRAFPDRHELTNALRITCPANEADFARLCDSLQAAARRNPAAFQAPNKEPQS